MRHLTAPFYGRAWFFNGLATTPPLRHHGGRPSILGWIQVLFGGFIEARKAHATYFGLVEQGVAPDVAIRTSFDLVRRPPEVAAVVDQIAAAQCEDRECGL